MSQSFIISASVFVIIMTFFHIIKDIFLPTDLNSSMHSRVNKRWLISTAIGLVLLYVIYGCTPSTDICTKQEVRTGVVCTEIYQPIRAPDGTVYANSCYAETDGWDNSCLILEPVYD